MLSRWIRNYFLEIWKFRYMICGICICSTIMEFDLKRVHLAWFCVPCRANIFPCHYFPCRAVPRFSVPRFSVPCRAKIFRAMIFRAGPCHKSVGPPVRAVPGRPWIAASPPLIDWISHGITNWIYSDPDPFVSHAKNLGPIFWKYFAPMYPLAEDMSKIMGPIFWKYFAPMYPLVEDMSEIYARPLPRVYAIFLFAIE